MHTRLGMAAAVLALWPATTFAQVRYELDGQTLRVSEATAVREVPLGCAGVELVMHGGAAWVRCPDGEIVHVVLDPSGDRVERLDVHGAQRLLRVDGELWIRRAAGVERLVGAAPGAPAVSEGSPSLGVPTRPVGPPEPPPPPAPEWPEAGAVPPPPAASDGRGPGPIVGNVERVGLGEVMVRLDLGARVQDGDGIAFLAMRDAASGLVFESGAQGTEEVVAAHGVVTAVQERQARVRLQVGAVASVGMRARQVDAPGLEVFPEIPAGLFSIAFHVRPFIPIGTLGVGLISDVSLRYTFDFGLVIGIDAMPLGVAAANNGDAIAGLGALFVGFANPYFGLGLHVGVSSVRGVWPMTTNQAFVVVPMVMLGSRDGFMLRLRSSAMVLDDQFRFGEFDGSIYIPLVHGVQLITNGRGGFAGTNFGELGLRMLLQGNGRADSIFFTGTVGFAMLIADTPGFSNAGPSIGLGLEWRP
jgi:hypothetical protein